MYIMYVPQECGMHTSVMLFDNSYTVLPRCYAPSLFATYFQEKGGGGRNSKDLC